MTAMAAAESTARSMIDTAYRQAGWMAAGENAASTAYILAGPESGALVTVLWDGAGDVFAATRVGVGGQPVPERLGVIPMGDTAAAQAVVLGWSHARDQVRPEVQDLSTPPATVTELDSVMRRVMRP
ncbi:hypothetical protein GFY24_00960 [Nocardia sp. SYP-A9097]|uniref:hypothetical protein n=1 Tax=Nocardia sp. SYP-A9097 TaxID=2663237 RepID=UPI00129A8C95|nr:hypothetical protein [Nocardia sp. SYP-A9097]MRH86047.1 hypothetical protein [Nocardia sp. SYP-A9097]